MLIQSALRQPYRRETWTTILLDLFPADSLKLREKPFPIEDVAHEQVEGPPLQLGTITLANGERVAVIEVAVKDSVKLARNRIALRNFIGKLIVPGSSDAVLAVFHQPGRDDWRLTYASRRTTLDPETFAVTHSETSPRRFTFLLGPGETCRTAAGRLKELEEKEKLTLDELERAFSVERLNKDFFKRYKEFYERFTAHLLSSEKAAITRKAFGIPVLAEPKEQDKADKPVRDFSKKLLGRLVFLHFLQKKRWLGCPKGSTDWSGGEENFIADFFEKSKAAGEADRFHSKYLTPLFFEALNTPDRKGDIFPLTGTRLPYLNGGLFEEDAPALRALDFPPLLFEELLGFFGEYHFTIDENDPEDHEVGIDPEMLGHIFENLLEDNKDKGAFYTPKAIVQYMARESLRHYLETHLGPDPEIALLLAEKDLTRLDKNGFVKQHARKIATLLEDVKVCDPAIGSGAFPIGLLQEILWTRLTLNWELNTPEDRARLKREIIKNSIHGVDLDPGAVEIARLRFWLALVVDEEIPRPLPNLDYKIHRADSLVEYIRGEPAHLGDVNTAGGMMKAAVDELIAAKKSLFDAHRLPEKRAARFALYRALASLAQLEFTRMRNDEGLFGSDPVRTAQLDKGVKEFGQRIREIDGDRKQKAAMQDTCLARLQDWFDDPERPTFLWHLHFGEVFAKGGFDIVIANPPYVRTKGIPGTYKELLWTRYGTFERKADLYVCFLEQALTLGKEQGVFCFITSNSYLRLDSFEALRKYLCKSAALRELIEFQQDVFENAAVRTAILIGIGKSIAGNISVAVGDTVFEALSQRRRLIPQSNWSSAHRHIFDIGSNSSGDSLKKKMRDGGISLGLVCEISFGLKTGNDSKFIARQPFSENNHQLFRGKNIKRWKLQWDGEYVWYDTGEMRKHRKTARPGTSARFEQPKVLVRDTGAVLEAAYDDSGAYVKDVLILNARPSSSVPLLSISAIINSTPVRWFYETTYQTIHVQQNELATIPIPPATPEEQTRLATLAERAAGFAKSGDKDSLRATEREIDGIVHQLFHLTPAEIALIEEALP